MNRPIDEQSFDEQSFDEQSVDEQSLMNCPLMNSPLMNSPHTFLLTRAIFSIHYKILGARDWSSQMPAISVTDLLRGPQFLSADLIVTEYVILVYPSCILSSSLSSCLQLGYLP